MEAILSVDLSEQAGLAAILKEYATNNFFTIG